MEFVWAQLGPLGPLHICYGCVAWCSCETPKSGSVWQVEGGDRSLLLFCLCLIPFYRFNRFLHPALIWGFVLSLVVTYYDAFDWYPWEACSFMKRNGGEVNLRGKGKTKRSVERINCNDWRKNYKINEDQEITFSWVVMVHTFNPSTQ